jgi:DNA-binding response OmpR family regulator
LLKPISPLEILKSVRRALNEKSRMITDEMIEAENARIAKATKPKIYKIGKDITIDCARRTIFCNEKTIQLTPTESRLFEALLESPNQVVSHVELVGRVQGYHVSPVDAAKILRPVMSRLRHKLEELPGGDDWIKNIRGSGYLLELPIVD